MRVRHCILSFAAAVAGALCFTAQAGVEVSGLAEATVATVNGAEVKADEFNAAVTLAARQKYYHRQPPEEKLAEFRREVMDGMINRILLARDAEKLGIAPDAGKIDAALAAYDERYKASAQWQQARAGMLPALRERMEEQSRVEQLEARVRDVGAPSEADLRAFYEAQQALFTEPDKVRLRFILLKVDPSSPRAAWDKAREEAAAIRARIEKGADFADLAQLHSADVSSSKGGDMGFLHRGTMPAALHDEIDKLREGDVSEPLTLLEGVGLMKVIERAPAKVVPFESAKQRVASLWKRQTSERAWSDYIARLRAEANIQINGNRFPDYVTAAAIPAGK